MERIGVNAAFNAGAILQKASFWSSRGSKARIANRFSPSPRAPTASDNFRFWDYPILMPETSDPDTNVYDMRLVKHEDGWIYGLFCTERKDPKTPSGTPRRRSRSAALRAPKT